MVRWLASARRWRPSDRNGGAKNKFVIFLNTAHHPGAVVATFGHEIGHYIYGSLVGERAPMAAFLEGTFSNHLHEEDELFADSLVAFSAYSHDLIKEIGPLKNVIPGKSDELFGRIRRAYGLVGTRYELDLTERKMGKGSTQFQHLVQTEVPTK